MRTTGGRRAWTAGLLAVGLTIGLAGCAEDDPEDFTADNRSSFLAACTEPLEDSRTVSAICQCVFDETQAAFSFERFEAIDEELLLDPEAELPDEIVEIVARCVVDEAEL